MIDDDDYVPDNWDNSGDPPIYDWDDWINDNIY